MQYLIPSIAPGNIVPLISKIVRNKQGAVAVMQTTLPDDFTPGNVQNDCFTHAKLCTLHSEVNGNCMRISYLCKDTEKPEARPGKMFQEVQA